MTELYSISRCADSRYSFLSTSAHARVAE